MRIKIFLVIVGVSALLMGLRIYESGLYNTCAYGRMTVYGYDGTVAEYDLADAPHISRLRGYVRIDLNHKDDLPMVLQRLKVKIKFTEQAAGVNISYGYSDRVEDYEMIKGHRINLMIAETDSTAVIGSPVIIGSY